MSNKPLAKTHTETDRGKLTGAHPETASNSQPPVALITGAARRIGASIAQHLHQHGYRVLIHYRDSQTEAQQLAALLNQQRANSAQILRAELSNLQQLESLAREAVQHWGQLDLLINNASSFFPTPVGDVTEQHWNDLLGSNLKAPFFLSQALAEALRKQHGCIINLASTAAKRWDMSGYGAYAAIKEAIRCGAAKSVDDIGKQLKAGTNCGSCIPEIKKL